MKLKKGQIWFDNVGKTVVILLSNEVPTRWNLMRYSKSVDWIQWNYSVHWIKGYYEILK